MPDISIYEFAGRAPAFLRLAEAHHRRCVADPVLNHPFSHAGQNPDHIRRLGLYWGEVFGGPPAFSQLAGGQSEMLELHARMGAEDGLGARFLDCFVAAADDAELPTDLDLRRALRDYMQWAVDDVMRYSPYDAVVAPGLAVPHWTWDGLAP
jgi:hemoglobin